MNRGRKWRSLTDHKTLKEPMAGRSGIRVRGGKKKENLAAFALFSGETNSGDLYECSMLHSAGFSESEMRH